MSTRNIVVIGASAGGVEALTRVFRELEPDVAASFFVVLHTVADAESHLPQILSRAGPLRAVHPEDGEKIEPGTIYVSRPNHHLLIEDGHVRSVIGAHANGYRPSVDLLFESAARAFGRQVVGVVLSGSLDDGTLGLQKIKEAGGVAIVQDPDELVFTGMPQSALDKVEVDYCVPASSIAKTLGEIAKVELELEPVSTSGEKRQYNELADKQAVEAGISNVAGFSCPECGGVLRAERSGDLTGFRCHVGHYLSERALLRAQGDTLENALWTALRVLEERIQLANQISTRADERGNNLIATRFREQNEDAYRKAEIIRSVLLGGDGHKSISAFQRHPSEAESIDPQIEPGT